MSLFSLCVRQRFPFTGSTLFPACIEVSHLENVPQANGIYIPDGTLKDCSMFGRNRYRHVDDNYYLWFENAGGEHVFWLVSTVLCDAQADTTLAYVQSNASSPQLAVAGSWVMMDIGSTEWKHGSHHPALTVGFASCPKYGKHSTYPLVPTSFLFMVM